MAERPGRQRRPALAVLLSLAIGLAVAACESFGPPPGPTPLDFPGLADQLALQGLTVAQPKSADAGCNDPTLIPTAIGFDISGLGVTTPSHARVYLFADGPTYDRLRPEVDTCVAAWASDPATIEFIETSPFVLVVQGPVPDAFKAALRTAVRASATGTEASPIAS